jgi:GTP-binding protein HflX
VLQATAEKSILVGLETPNNSDANLSLEELGRLAETAGVEVAGSVLQKRNRPDGRYYIGRGKAEELREKCAALEADLVIFDVELSAVQVRNLEELLDCRVIDRTNVILDIFAQRARTKEGKLQVELAQLRYLLPRLLGKGITLSRLGAGIGTRGPGETKFETDRRHIRRRIRFLERELELIRQRRKLQRERRERLGFPRVALVGYTNAGKSTLLNSLAKAADALAQDQLFSTLDPLSRLVKLPDGRQVLVSDTVGFVRKLPHHLVAAFRATLEEVKEADLILHVIDLSSPDMENQKQAVEAVLRELETQNNPMLLVYNKIDLVEAEQTDWLGLGESHTAVAISAQTGAGIPELLRQIALRLDRPGVEVDLELPLKEARLLSLIHDYGEVLSQRYAEERILVTAWIEPRIFEQVLPYVVKGSLVQPMEQPGERDKNKNHFLDGGEY